MEDYSSLYITATGEIIEVGETAGLTAPDGTQSVYAGDSDPEIHYIVGGVLTERPTISGLENFTLEGDGVDSFSVSVPNGTVITDLETTTTYTASGTETVTFTSTTAGAWDYLFEPPFPYVSGTVRITVNDNLV